MTMRVHNLGTPAPHGSPWARQRGATMVSVMLLTVSLMTLGLLVVRSSVREVTQAGQLVARERARPRVDSRARASRSPS